MSFLGSITPPQVPLSEFLLIVSSLLGVAFFSYRRLLHYLKYYQQEEYLNSRFFSWVIRRRAFDRRGSFALVLLLILAAALKLHVLASVVALPLLLALGLIEDDPRISGRKLLAMTERATRILRVALVLLVLIELILVIASLMLPQSRTAVFLLSQLLLIQGLASLLMLANVMLAPAETRLQHRLLSEAQEILRRTRPVVVGITGSYGKTTTKHIVARFLNQATGPAFCPPQSINTLMGITKCIREGLLLGHRFAVIEMGAYKPGSIRRLCKLTPPDVGIVTGVGIMHLERFGSREAVYQAKSELPAAVPSDGLLVCNGDEPGSRKMATEFRKKTTLLYGMDNSRNDLDCHMDDIKTSVDGTSFTLSWKKAHFSGSTPLLGKPALLNIMAAFCVACEMGADPEYLLAIIRGLEAEDNRMKLEKGKNRTIIHDAYNSNPVGFSAALEILSVIPGEKKALITPGMVELGDAQAAENVSIAKQAAAVCDSIHFVGETNRQAWQEGLESAAFPMDRFFLYDNMKEALKRLSESPEDGSGSPNKEIVLIENDLGDLYEARIRM